MKKKKRKKQIYSKFVNGKRVHKETRIEKRMRFMLSLLKIDFIPEKDIRFGKFTRYYDFYCYNLEEGWKFVIECHGDYYHAANYHEGTTAYSKLYKQQRKNIKNDQLKEKILNELKIPLLVFWETEILKQPRVVIKKIKDYINSIKVQQ